MPAENMRHVRDNGLEVRLCEFFTAAGYPHLPRQTIVDEVRRGLLPEEAGMDIYDWVIRAHGFNGTEATRANRTPSADIDPDDPVLEELEAAIDGACRAAPEGEGVAGAMMFAARAALLVTRGMKAPEAVAAAIGERGTYGVPRKYGLVPRPIALRTEGRELKLWFAMQQDVDQAIKGIGETGAV